MKLLNKILGYSFLIFLFTACSVQLNVPYIDTDETLKLSIGMTKDQVLSDLGEPAMVKSGKDSTTEWGYEVRYKTIRSAPGDYPLKKGKFVGTTFPANSLILVFENDILVEWYTDNINGTPFIKKINPVETIVKILVGTVIFSVVVSG